MIICVEDLLPVSTVSSHLPESLKQPSRTSSSKYTNPPPKPLMNKGDFIFPFACLLLFLLYLLHLFSAHDFFGDGFQKFT